MFKLAAGGSSLIDKWVRSGQLSTKRLRTMANPGYIESRLFSGHSFPVLLDCNFFVDSTSPLGIRSLKGAYIQDVFMNTVASITGDLSSDNIIDNIPDISGLEVGMALFGAGIVPGTVIDAIDTASSIIVSIPTIATSASVPIVTAAPGSPNPGPGFIYVKLQANYNRLLFSNAGFQGILDGTDVDIVDLVAGTAYVITDLGTQTTADWVLAGVPLGVTPALGVGFIASGYLFGGSAGGTCQMQAQATTSSLQLVGDSDKTLSPYIYQNNHVTGGILIYQCFGADKSVNPIDGEFFEIEMYVSNSSTLVGGQ